MSQAKILWKRVKFLSIIKIQSKGKTLNVSIIEVFKTKLLPDKDLSKIIFVITTNFVKFAFLIISWSSARRVEKGVSDIPFVFLFGSDLSKMNENGLWSQKFLTLSKNIPAI